jgi:hypothetical protein
MNVQASSLGFLSGPCFVVHNLFVYYVFNDTDFHITRKNALVTGSQTSNYPSDCMAHCRDATGQPPQFIRPIATFDVLPMPAEIRDYGMTIRGKKSLRQTASRPKSFSIEPEKDRERHSHDNCDGGQERVAHTETQSIKHPAPKQGESKGKQASRDLFTITDRALGTDNRRNVGERRTDATEMAEAA